MSTQTTHFDIYGAMAKDGANETCQNGRYSIQQGAEKYVPADVIAKLRVKPDDHVLDIGCGLGLNMKPLAEQAAHVTGCDHPDVIARTSGNINGDNIELIGGNFLTLELNKSFDKIMAYSVLPALPDKETVFEFVDKALGLLKPSGRMLLGDLSNSDKKARFAGSMRGQEFQKEWERESAAHNIQNDLAAFSGSEPTVGFNDQLVFELALHIRKKNFHAYIVDQPQNLPFGNSREDILVIGPEYDEGAA